MRRKAEVMVASKESEDGAYSLQIRRLQVQGQTAMHTW